MDNINKDTNKSENKIDDTLKERRSRYGKFEENARITQSLMDVIQTAPSYDRLSQMHKEIFHMIFHKIARSVCGDPDYLDNIHDIVGYAIGLENYLKDKQDWVEYNYNKFNGSPFSDDVEFGIKWESKYHNCVGQEARIKNDTMNIKWEYVTHYRRYKSQ